MMVQSVIFTSDDGIETVGLYPSWIDSEWNEKNLVEHVRILIEEGSMLETIHKGAKIIIQINDSIDPDRFLEEISKKIRGSESMKFQLDIIRNSNKVALKNDLPVEALDENISVEDIIGRELNIVGEDAEHFWDSSCYETYIRQLVEITNGEIEFEDISVLVKGNNYVVNLKSGDQEYSFEIEGGSDWIDFLFFKKINNVLKKMEKSNNYFFPIVPDKVGDQVIEVEYITRDQYEVLRKHGYVFDYVEE